MRHPGLSGLGRNPAAPRGVLLRLAAHAVGRDAMSRRPGRLPDAVVEAMVAYGDGHSAVGLHGGRVSPAMRRRIAAHPDPAIRDAFPGFVRGMVDSGVPLGIAALEEAYGLSRTELVGARDPKLRAAVARGWRDRPAAVQAALLADPDPEVRGAAAEGEHGAVPPELRESCLADEAVRARVAGRVPLTWDQFTRLVDSGDKGVRHAVAGNRHLSAEMVARLLDDDDPAVRVSMALSRHVDARTRDRLYALVEAERATGSGAAEVALHWNFAEPEWLREAPLAERLTYLDCPHAVFRRVLASCRDLPEEAWRRLDDDPELLVRHAAARRPDVPPEVLERLVRAHGEISHLRPWLTDHPRFPRHLLRTFADEPGANVRVVALQDPELPVPFLWRLADPDESWLRRGVAGHPGVTDELLERLLSDPDPEVVREAAANPVLRAARMEGILVAAGL